MKDKELPIAMKTHHSTRFLGLLCAAALSSCANNPEPNRLPVAATINSSTPAIHRQNDKSLRGQLFDDVNSYRRSKGASAVQRHSGLDRLAQNHCEYLLRNRGTFSLYGKNVSHYGLEGRATVARERFQMSACSENVAAANNPGSAASPIILELWKKSKDHHENMIDKWTHSGIGVVVDSDGTVFATQMFATITYSQMSMRERMNGF